MTAAEQYNDVAHHNIQLLAKLADAVLRHMERQKRDFENNGYIGDMSECKRRIEEAIKVLE